MSGIDFEAAERAFQKRQTFLFWRRRDVDEILAKVRQSPVLILAGPGMGKTFFLRLIAQKLGDEQQNGIWWIDGRNTSEARLAVLATAHAAAPAGSPRVVLLDSLDAMCRLGEMDSPALRDVLFAGLWNIRQGQPASSARFVVTAELETASPSLFRLAPNLPDRIARAQWIKCYSDFTQQLMSYRLDPWYPGWQQSWDVEFNLAFGRLLKKPLLALWRKIILELTGGHPVLAGPALALLDRLCSGSGCFGPGTAFELKLVNPSATRLGATELQLLERDIRRYVEDCLVRNVVRRIASTVRRLSGSQNPLESASFDALVQMAKTNPFDAKPPRDSVVRQILVDEGLIYEDKSTGLFAIPGSIIVKQVRDTWLLRQTTASRTWAVSPDPEDPERGVLVARTQSGELRLELTGTPWRVLRALDSRPGEVLSAKTLEDMAHLSGQGSVRNAVQRLQQKLSACNLGYVVTNEYRKGYRLVLPSL